MKKRRPRTEEQKRLLSARMKRWWKERKKEANEARKAERKTREQLWREAREAAKKEDARRLREAPASELITRVEVKKKQPFSGLTEFEEVRELIRRKPDGVLTQSELTWLSNEEVRLERIKQVREESIARWRVEKEVNTNGCSG